jgi:hypothetical protein
MAVHIPDLDDLEEVPLPSVPVTRGNPFAASAQSITGMVKKGMSSIDTVERNGRLWASQAAVCPRQAVLSSTRHDTELTTPASTGYFRLGSCIEDIVIDALKKEGALLWAQYKLPDIGLNLGGSIDGVVLVGGRVKVLEIKSCGELPAEPKLEHRAQAMVYSAVTGLPPIVFYFSRSVASFDGALKVREFNLSPSVDEMRATMFQVAYARIAIERGVIPGIPDTITAEKQCGFCPWKSHCWRDAPLPRKGVDVFEHVEIVTEARAMVDALMTPEALRKRRNGVLSFLSKYGAPDVQEKLTGDWSSLLGDAGED